MYEHHGFPKSRDSNDWFTWQHRTAFSRRRGSPRRSDGLRERGEVEDFEPPKAATWVGVEVARRGTGHLGAEEGLMGGEAGRSEDAHHLGAWERLVPNPKSQKEVAYMNACRLISPPFPPPPLFLLCARTRAGPHNFFSFHASQHRIQYDRLCCYAIIRICRPADTHPSQTRTWDAPPAPPPPPSSPDIELQSLLQSQPSQDPQIFGLCFVHLFMSLSDDCLSAAPEAHFPVSSVFLTGPHVLILPHCPPFNA